MSEYSDKLSQLQQRLDKMVEYQGYFDREINQIRTEIKFLRAEYQKQNPPQKPQVSQPPIVNIPPIQTAPQVPQAPPMPRQIPPTQSSYSNNYTDLKPSKNANLEKFIGENLISKVGIIILIIGVAIGAKYAIDNNWISPLMRIVFGYLVGLGLVGFAVKLKPKYLNFSAVLLSGGMATMYFITYFAYSYYNLLSQISAFSVMLIFTIFTVLAAIIYNQQVIAQIGLVGAYAIPFLLSENSGKVEILFTYIAIINVGILALSAKKYWKSLFYSSFIFTWISFIGWFATKYHSTQDFTLALTFLSIFFLIFYGTFLIYKLLNHQTLGEENVFFVLTNSFIFYGFGYGILQGKQGWENSLGFFTLFNSFIHFGIGFLIKQFRLGDKTVFYLTVILVLTFFSIAFPIQSKGEWTVLFWTAEAATLFAIGRLKQISIFENYSYPVMGLASFALLVDWGNLMSKGYSIETIVYPFLNKHFVVGLFFVLGFGSMVFLNRNKNYLSSLPIELAEIVKFGLGAVFLFALYNIFRNEIANYFSWQQLTTAVQIRAEYDDSVVYPFYNPSISSFNFIWQLNYTIIYLTGLAWVNIKKIKSAVLGYSNLLLNSLVTALFLLIGLYIFSTLRDLYLNGGKIEYFQYGIYNLLIRYLSIPLILLLFWTSYNYIKQEFINRHFPIKTLLILFDLSFYFSLWIIITSELLHWLDIFDVKDSYKLGLSILWGIYSLTLIILGIYFRKAHLRIKAIVLFCLTLLKLFLYDLSDLGTISKTIVFVSLGILLLIISFLYNKYKNLIFDEAEI